MNGNYKSMRMSMNRKSKNDNTTKHNKKVLEEFEYETKEDWKPEYRVEEE